jgi:flagellar biosynthesis/type III secretory pathway M-ring protein FliF/YscJ
MYAMEKDKKLIFFTLVGVCLLCILSLATLWRQALQFLRRRRSLRQDDNDNDDDAAVMLEDIMELETNRRSSCELQEEVKSLRETQAHVRSILQSLQSKLEEKDATSKALNYSRDKIE